MGQAEVCGLGWVGACTIRFCFTVNLHINPSISALWLITNIPLWTQCGKSWYHYYISQREVGWWRLYNILFSRSWEIIYISGGCVLLVITNLSDTFCLTLGVLRPMDNYMVIYSQSKAVNGHVAVASICVMLLDEILKPHFHYLETFSVYCMINTQMTTMTASWLLRCDAWHSALHITLTTGLNNSLNDYDFKRDW